MKTLKDYLLYIFWMLVLLSQAVLSHVMGPLAAGMPAVMAAGFVAGALAIAGLIMLIFGLVSLRWYNVLPGAILPVITVMLVYDKYPLYLALWAGFGFMVFFFMGVILLMNLFGPRQAEVLLPDDEDGSAGLLYRTDPKQ